MRTTSDTSARFDDNEFQWRKIMMLANLEQELGILQEIALQLYIP